jgi:hypothetical protein
VVCRIIKPIRTYTISSGEFVQFEGTDNDTINSVVVQGNYVYLGTHTSFRIFDISDPHNPQTIAFIPLAVDSIEVLGEHVYLTSNELRIFDISNPRTPVEVYCEDSSLFEEFSNPIVVDDHAYIPRGKAGLQILDITNPSILTEVGNYSPQSPPRLQLAPEIDLTRSQPRIVTSIASHAHYAFVAESLLGGDSLYDGLISVLDISNPNKPKVVNTYRMPNNVGVYKLFISGSYLLATASYLDFPSIVMLDISDPIILKEIATPNFPNGLIAFFESYALFANGSSGLEIWDLSNPANPIQHTWDDLNYGFVKEVAISGNYAYFATIYGGFRVVDITDPVNPVTVSINFD